MPGPPHSDESPRRFTRLGLAVVVVLAVVIGVVVGRVTAGEPSPRPVAETTDEADPTVDAIGPTSLDAGVPMGYGHSEAGAVAAATTFVTGLDASTTFDDEAREDALDAIAATESRDALGEQMRTGVEAAVEGLGITPEVVNDPAFVARTVPAGYRVASYSDSEAVVDVWSAVVFLAPERRAEPVTWSTDTVAVRWEDGDWRLVSFESTPGPDPDSDVDAATRINGFERYTARPLPE